MAHAPADSRPSADAGSVLVAFAAVTVVVVLRYTLLLALYAEYDDVLAGDAGLAALDVLTSTWITGGLPRNGRFRGGPDRPGRLPRSRSRIAGALAALGELGERRRWRASLTAFASLAGFASAFAPPGPEKAGRILIDDRYCGIWEPTHHSSTRSGTAAWSTGSVAVLLITRR